MIKANRLRNRDRTNSWMHVPLFMRHPVGLFCQRCHVRSLAMQRGASQDDNRRWQTINSSRASLDCVTELCEAEEAFFCVLLECSRSAERTRELCRQTHVDWLRHGPLDCCEFFLLAGFFSVQYFSSFSFRYFLFLIPDFYRFYSLLVSFNSCFLHTNTCSVSLSFQFRFKQF